MRIFAEAEDLAPEAGSGKYVLDLVKVLEIVPGYQSTRNLLSHLSCPNLKLLILECSAALCLRGSWPWPPSMEELWLALTDGIETDYSVSDLNLLHSYAPRLRNLRIDSGVFPFKTHLLAELLEQRFDNAEAGLEVDGQPMVFLEKLVVSKKYFGKKVVSRLEEVVGKVVDSKDVPDRIEIDLSESTLDEVSVEKVVLSIFLAVVIYCLN